MIRIPLGAGAYRRTYGDLPEVRMENRFFESNPTTEEGSSLLSRPGTANLFGIVGDAPFRALFTKEGVFGGDLFYANASGLYRYELGETPQLIADSPAYGSFDISFAAAFGLYYEHLFVAYEGTLRYYEGESYSRGFFRRGAADALTDQVLRVGGVYYAWRDAGTVDTGSPDGTLANPYLVDYPGGLVAGDVAGNLEAMTAMMNAINASGEPGTDYSSTLTARNPDVRAVEITQGVGIASGVLTLHIEARERGSAGDLLELEVISGSGVVAGNASGTGALVTLEGGGLHVLLDVTLPEGLEVGRVVALGAYVLVIEQNSNRFFFIRPGEVEVRALDYESAEAEPDVIVDAVTAGDFTYLFGRSSVETWYVAGDAERPVQRMAGGSFRVGAVGGTVALVQQTPVFVGTDNLVYALGGGAPQRISDHGIEERLRTVGMLSKIAWSFSLDGHFFYVLTIESQGTFVYDATVQQWYRWWTEGREPYWTGVRGAQWRTFSIGIDWAGDDMWHIDPTAFTDESPAVNISRVVTGFLPLRERKHARNSLVRVYASVGNHEGLDPAPTLVLRFSDDNGKTWSASFEIELTADEKQQLDFRSLGKVGFPGRIFEFSDTAGLLRIDGAYAQLD